MLSLLNNEKINIKTTDDEDEKPKKINTWEDLEKYFPKLNDEFDEYSDDDEF